MTLHTLKNGLVIPAFLYAELKAHPEPVLLGNPVRNRLCANCGGLGAVRLLFLRQYNGTGPRTWYQGRWYGYDDRRCPCPICNADNTERVAALRAASGLLPHEYDIDPAYCLQYPDKADTVRQALTLLAQTPHPVGWMSIYGGYGVGKTMLVKGLVARFVTADVPAHYTTSAKILSELRSTYGESGASENDVMSWYASVRVLVVDEVDRASDTAWARERLFTVLNNRYALRHSMLTVLCTNSAPGRMAAEWAYLESRMSDGIRTVMGGQDLRGRK